MRAESSWPQVISQVFEVGLKLSRGPQKKAFCRSALAVRSNAPPSLSFLFASVPLCSAYSVNRLCATDRYTRVYEQRAGHEWMKKESQDRAGVVDGGAQ